MGRPYGHRRTGSRKIRAIFMSAAMTIAVVIGIAVFTFTDAPPKDSVTDKPDQTPAHKPPQSIEQATIVTGRIEKKPRINYTALSTDARLKNMMAERKSSLGIKDSLDMIVKSDETFTVGKTTVSMQKILDQVLLSKGQVIQKEIDAQGNPRPLRINTYGIYVVQPGDNIWNIHFRILTDYYRAKGINIENKADEPGTEGKSSGVGKILKFSEAMVIIYNMTDGKIDQDINLLEPLSKVIVYNMDDIFALLEEIRFENVDRLQFDGKNIWIPASNH